MPSSSSVGSPLEPKLPALAGDVAAKERVSGTHEQHEHTAAVKKDRLEVCMEAISQPIYRALTRASVVSDDGDDVRIF
jgi:hypothetical protein